MNNYFINIYDKTTNKNWKEEFESYKQHISNKFLDYKTSNELNDILNDYLPIEVFQRLIEDYAKKEQLHEHNNKDIYLSIHAPYYINLGIVLF